MTAAQAAKALEDLGKTDWHVKLALDRFAPEPMWRVWLSWRRGPEPHKEESTRVPDLKGAAEWCTKTIEAWDYE